MVKTGSSPVPCQPVDTDAVQPQSSPQARFLFLFLAESLPLAIFPEKGHFGGAATKGQTEQPELETLFAHRTEAINILLYQQNYKGQEKNIAIGGALTALCKISTIGTKTK